MKKFHLLTLVLMLFSSYLYGNKVLTIYTYSSFSSNWGIGPEIKEIFENKYNCKIKFISVANSTLLLNKLRIENKNNKADIIIGLDYNSLINAKKTGLFTKHNIDLKKINIPVNWKWDDSIFIPYNYGYFTFIYNAKKIKNPPNSFQELIQNNKKWNIIYSDPRTSNSGFNLILWIQYIYKKNSFSAWKKLAKNTVTIPKGWGEAYALFLKGEADFFLTYTSSLAYFFSKNLTTYKVVNFSEGHYFYIEFAAKLLNSKNPILAEKFMEFILSKSFQKIILFKNWMYPVIKISMPKYYKDIIIPKNILQYSPEEIEKKRKQWINIWKNAINQ